MLSNRRGSALVEFAVSLIVLSTLLTGIFQLGYAFYAYETLVHAVRAGARYASLQGADATNAKDFAISVRNLVAYGDPKPARDAKPVVAGLEAQNVDLTLEAGSASVSIKSFAIDALFTKFRLDGRPSVTFPRGASR